MSQSVRFIVVDDTNPDIQYVGPWFLDTTGSQDTDGNFGVPYLETLHGTTSSASFSYSFTGTYVNVLGTNNIRNDSGILDPQWTCFIDNISIGASSPFPFPENNWLLCSHDHLSEGTYVITVNATVAKQQTFWFDQITYLPLTNVPLNDKVILVNQSDPSLQFDSDWRALDGLRKVTTQLNSVFRFEFVGVSLSWYGVIPDNYPRSASRGSYSIDGGPPIVFPLNGLPSENAVTQFYQEFFQTPSYPAGSHEIVVTYLGDSQSTPLTLEYLLVQNGTLDTTPTTTSALSSSTSPTFHGVGSSTIPSSASTVVGLAPSNSTASNTLTAKIGIIVGGVIGGLVLLAVVIILYLWYRRIMRLEHQVQEANITAQPFPYAPTSTSGQSVQFITGIPQVAEGVQHTYYHPHSLQRVLSMGERKNMGAARTAASVAGPRYSTSSVSDSATIVER
ncbi:hypothetical protein CPC08DRAFT_707651 [Agrocybe pediades]|nr:hypothetical protein CPC08DRAFT_707651 [Agrocybe pediades]